MITKIIKQVFKLILLSFLGTPFVYSEKPLIIDFSKIKEMRLPLSLLGKKVEYIPLETKSECLLKGPIVYATDKYIIATDAFRGVYLFDRKTGKFIREISRRGQGPNEYNFIIIPAYYGFNEKRNIQFVSNINSWKGFDIETNKQVIEIKNPEFVYKNLYKGIASAYFYTDSTFLGYTNNVTGKVQHKLVLFNKKGEVQRVYPNHVFWEKKAIDYPFFFGNFYKFRDKLCFQERSFNDTIFEIKKESLIPHIIFKWSKKQQVVQNKIEGAENRKTIDLIKETEKYVLLRSTVQGEVITKNSVYFYYYDKLKNELYTCAEDDKGLFFNDIDGFVNVSPKESHSGEFSCTIDPEVWIEKVKTENELAPRLKKLQVKYDDNPIVMIVGD